MRSALACAVVITLLMGACKGKKEGEDEGGQASARQETAARPVTVTAQGADRIGLETSTAALSALGERVTLLGTLDVDRDEPLVSIKAPQAGPLSEVAVGAGDFVKEGQKLAVQGAQTVTAPVSATVAQVNARSGDPVTQGQTIMSLIDVSRLVAYLDVYEDQLSKVHPGQSVLISLPALPQRTFSGRLQNVSPQLDPQTRSAVVRVAVANAQGLLKPGMAVSGTIALPGPQKGVVAPQSAVVMDAQGGSWVYVQIKPLSFVRQPVQVEFIGGQQVWIKQGLSPGQVFASVGAQELFSEEFSGQISTED